MRVSFVQLFFFLFVLIVLKYMCMHAELVSALFCLGDNKRAKMLSREWLVQITWSIILSEINNWIYVAPGSQ